MSRVQRISHYAFAMLSGLLKNTTTHLCILINEYNGYMQERHSHSTHTPLIEIIA